MYSFFVEFNHPISRQHYKGLIQSLIMLLPHPMSLLPPMIILLPHNASSEEYEDTIALLIVVIAGLILVTQFKVDAL